LLTQVLVDDAFEALPPHNPVAWSVPGGITDALILDFPNSLLDENKSKTVSIISCYRYSQEPEEEDVWSFPNENANNASISQWFEAEHLHGRAVAGRESIVWRPRSAVAYFRTIPPGVFHQNIDTNTISDNGSKFF